ncbi:dense granule protein GRA9 [Besnoitia besnoiti]|uniref:Dense granule protein GRA9 n=1 Tax=Besnoitia besnoiti TaxID=94643 RepID=A0A2A9M742_BESBE|nr:dense granule protein GRA9 [Besnoitia besnoiti]PFH31463.1 dense granule protein GRA9 [Besnoitia besnoiti]
MRTLKSVLAPLSAVVVAATTSGFISNIALTRSFAAEAGADDVTLAVPDDPNDPAEGHKDPEEVRDPFGHGWDDTESPLFGHFGSMDAENWFGPLQEMMKGLMGMGPGGFGSPFFGGAFGGGFPRLRFPKPKTSLEKVGSCRYLVSWAAGVSAENVRVILHRRRRTVEVRYRMVTRRDVKTDKSEHHSVSKEQSSQTLSVDRQCIMTVEVIGEKLAGWTDNSAQAAGGAAHRLLITFPSPAHIEQMIKEGHLPADTLTRIEKGDFSGFTVEQRCLISGRTLEECKFAKEHQVELEEKETSRSSDASTQDSLDLPRFSHHSGDL